MNIRLPPKPSDVQQLHAAVVTEMLEDLLQVIRCARSDLKRQGFFEQEAKRQPRQQQLILRHPLRETRKLLQPLQSRSERPKILRNVN